MKRAVLLSASLLTVLGCRPRAETSEVRELPAPRAARLAEVRGTLSACVDKEFNLAPLSGDEQARLDAIYGEFSGGECLGCHATERSYGSTGNFTVSPEAGGPEFFKGLALRHYLTREIATQCFAEGPARNELVAKLKANRFATDGTGRLFFQSGTEEEMRAMTMSFLQGGFEIASQPDDAPHEVVYAWIKSGGRFDAKTHVDILMDVIAVHGLENGL